jgi:hypothetical protein
MSWVILIAFLGFDAFLLAQFVWGIATARAPGRVGGILGAVLFFGGLANYALYAHASFRHGGSPHSGKAEDGRFYVMSHGRYTEVSEATWQYLQAHERSVWITHPLAALGCLLIIRFIRRENAAAAAQRQPGPVLPPQRVTGPTDRINTA